MAGINRALLSARKGCHGKELGKLTFLSELGHSNEIHCFSSPFLNSTSKLIIHYLLPVGLKPVSTVNLLRMLENTIFGNGRQNQKPQALTM
jgi:hypothetical protein